MHCVNCGTQNLETTRYCKSCGANLEVLRQALTQNVTGGPHSLVGPSHVGAILVMTAFMGLGGLAIVFGCLVALAKTIGPTLGNGLLPLLLMLGAVGVGGVVLIVTTLLRMLNVPAPKPGTGASGPIAPAAFEPVAERGLPEFREPVSSVVENTTSRLGKYEEPRRP